MFFEIVVNEGKLKIFVVRKFFVAIIIAEKRLKILVFFVRKLMVVIFFRFEFCGKFFVFLFLIE